MWDNRESKRNPKAPDFKCKNKDCDGVIWPPRAPAPTGAGAAPAAGPAAVPPGMPACPICGGAMWDDRTSKRNPKAPDFKCRNRPKFKGGPGCEGVIWPPRDGQASPYPAAGGGGGSATASRPRSSSAGPSRPARSAPSAPPPGDGPPPPDDRDFDPHFGGADDDDLPF